MYNRNRILTTALAAITVCSLLPATVLASPKKPGFENRGRTDNTWSKDHDDRDKPGNRGRTDNTWNNGHKKDKKDKKVKKAKHTNRGRTDNTWNKGRKDWDKYDSRRRTDNTWNKSRDYNDNDPRQKARNASYSWSQAEADKRQKTKNEWRNMALAAGGAAAYGLIRKDPTITFAGAAGALYSLHRYEQDRKSQSAASRVRASFFSQPYFTRDGRRYERRLVTKNGDRYYQFVRK